MLVSATALFSGCLSVFFRRGGLGVDLLKEKPPLGGLLTEPFGKDSVDNLLCGVGRETCDQIGTLGCGLGCTPAEGWALLYLSTFGLIK